MDPFKVRFSQLKTWRRCQRAHHYKYVQKIVPRKKSLPLERGSIIHRLTEANALGNDWREEAEAIERELRKKKIFWEEKEYYADLLKACAKLVEGYFKYWSGDTIEYTHVEHTFLVPLVPSANIVLQGTIDGRGKIWGKPWLVERKTHKRIPDETDRFWNYQVLLYAWALEELGMPVHGVLWDYIRTKPPTVPQVLKNGTVSKKKKIDTTWRVYREAILEAGGDPKDYSDMKEQLKGREGSFYRRTKFVLDEVVISRIINESRITALQIQALQEIPTRTLNPLTCKQCEYSPLCGAELRDLDVEEMRNREYEPEDEPGEENEEEPEEE